MSCKSNCNTERVAAWVLVRGLVSGEMGEADEDDKMAKEIFNNPE
jgi:hypothetical protein